MLDEPILLEQLPDEVRATMEARDRALDALGDSAGGLEAVVNTLARWLPGSTVRVAFLSGTDDLHREIAEVAEEISESCHLTLDFGRDPASGSFRRWSLSDTDYTAEIRVSFDQRGFFSLLGTDSVADNIGIPGGPVGGRPGQRSLNLGGFEIQRPSTWRGVVIHEFLHALGFHHEHVNLRGPCQEAFRFEDDPGYQPTRDANGVFVSDFAGRRPGIYTYLSGAPNFWSRATVDHNLRPSGGAGVVEGPFDRRSVMLYRFPGLFYRTPNSGCAPQGDGQSLSEGDVAGLRFLYPSAEDAVSAIVRQKKDALAGLEGVLGEAPAAAGLEAVADGAALDRSVLRGTHATLQRQLGG